MFSKVLKIFKRKPASSASSSAPKMTGKKAVHFGGGAIGRGFVAEFLHESGYEVVFVDVADDVINMIQNSKSYVVTEIGADDERTFTITNYRAINSKTHEADVIREIATADLVTCAVGPGILKFIAPAIAKGIDSREKSTPAAVIACENMINGTDRLKEEVDKNLKTSQADLPKKAQFANSAVDRVVPKQVEGAGVNVRIEKYAEWCIETKSFQVTPSAKPDIKGAHFVSDLAPYIERKLFTVNAGHATAGYFGYHYGIQYIHEAMKDERVVKAVKAALGETAHHIVTTHESISKKEQQEYVESVLKRFENPKLEDAVVRVGRDPIRKLGRNERLLSPAIALAEGGESFDALLGSIEMALRFQNVQGDDASAEVAKILSTMSSKDAIAELTRDREKSQPGLTEADCPKLFPKLEEVVAKVQADTKVAGETKTQQVNAQ